MARHPINTDLINDHWEEMIRVAASLKTGDITASLIVSRLWSTVYVDKAIEHLTARGLITDQDDLSKTSPTQRAHIKPYGRYTFHNEQAHDSLRPLHKPERTFPA